MYRVSFLSVFFLVFLLFFSSTVRAESCICELSSSNIDTKITGTTKIKTQYCVTLNANAFCVSGRHSGEIDAGCFSSKDLAQKKIDKMGSSFKCYFEDNKLMDKNPDTGHQIVIGGIVLMVIMLVLFCVCGGLIMTIVGCGLGCLFLSKNKTFMSWLGNRFFRVETI